MHNQCDMMIEELDEEPMPAKRFCDGLEGVTSAECERSVYSRLKFDV